MSFTKGDTVRVGKGKVEYTVQADPNPGDTFTNLQSHNTGKFSAVELDRLVLVKSAEDIARDAAPVTEGPLISTSAKFNPFQGAPDVAEEAGSSIEELAIPTLGEVRQQTRTHVGVARVRKARGQHRTQTEEEAAQIDHRLSTYGRAILAALQLPKFRPRAKKAKAARRNTKFKVVE